MQLIHPVCWELRPSVLATKAQYAGDQGSARWEARLSMLAVKALHRADRCGVRLRTAFVRIRTAVEFWMYV